MAEVCPLRSASGAVYDVALIFFTVKLERELLHSLILCAKDQKCEWEYGS